MYGKVESMKVRIGVGSKAVTEAFGCVVFVALTFCRPTTRSREISGARVKETLLGTNLEVS